MVMIQFDEQNHRIPNNISSDVIYPVIFTLNNLKKDIFYNNCNRRAIAGLVQQPVQIVVRSALTI